MKINKQSIKKYFTEKPKGDFWFHAFVTLIFFRYVIPPTLIFIVALQIGLALPDVEDRTLEDIHETLVTSLTEALSDPMLHLIESGQEIRQEHPLVGQFLLHGLSALIWGMWVAAILLAINLSRYGISYCIQAYRKKRGKS